MCIIELAVDIYIFFKDNNMHDTMHAHTCMIWWIIITLAALSNEIINSTVWLHSPLGVPPNVINAVFQHR